MSWQQPFPNSHTQIPCRGCNEHTLWVIEAGAPEGMKLYGNAYIRLNIAVFWDMMLCHLLSFFPMFFKDYCFLNGRKYLPSVAGSKVVLRILYCGCFKFCMCVFCNVQGVLHKFVGVWVICVLLFTYLLYLQYLLLLYLLCFVLFVLCFCIVAFYVYFILISFICTRIRTTATR